METGQIPTDTLAARTQLIQLAADKYQLPRDVVLAICRQESNLNRWVTRSEPEFRYLWDCVGNKPYLAHAQDLHSCVAPADFHGCPGDGESATTEWVNQRKSWGLMQPMGSLARELGFRGPLGQLLDIPTNLDVGCRHLVELHGKYFPKFGWSGVYAAYNSGSPALDGKQFKDQAYVDGVIKNGGPK